MLGFSTILWAEEEGKCISGDCLNGQGVKTWADGTKYEGEWLNGKQHGMGTITLPNGMTYEGSWQEDKMNGEGTIKNPDGTQYEGNFSNNEMDGHGVLTTSDGTVYNGEFKNGKLNGQATITRPDGTNYEGEFKDGKIEGRGTMTLPDGSKYVGEFKNNLTHGEGTLYDAYGDIVQQGRFENGKFVSSKETKQNTEKAFANGVYENKKSKLQSLSFNNGSVAIRTYEGGKWNTKTYKYRVNKSSIMILIPGEGAIIFEIIDKETISCVDITGVYKKKK